MKTAKLVIDEGALFEGKCSMSEDGFTSLNDIPQKIDKRNANKIPFGIDQKKEIKILCPDLGGILQIKAIDKPVVI